jgi:hypothetical protein
MAPCLTAPVTHHQARFRESSRQPDGTAKIVWEATQKHTQHSRPDAQQCPPDEVPACTARLLLGGHLGVTGWRADGVLLHDVAGDADEHACMAGVKEQKQRGETIRIAQCWGSGQGLLPLMPCMDTGLQHGVRVREQCRLLRLLQAAQLLCMWQLLQVLLKACV